MSGILLYNINPIVPPPLPLASSDEYSTNMMTIKQGASRSTHPELIDLTPPFDQQPNHVYGNTGNESHYIT